MARDVYIVRHGNTFDKGDTVTRVGARTDLPLSMSGRLQAEALAKHFADTDIRFASAAAGPLKRTLETARTILAAQSAAPSLDVAEFLREIDYGPDENRPEPEVVDRIGQAALDAWEKDAVAPPGWIVDPERLKRDWISYFQRLAGSDTADPALVVTSNGVARFALLAARETSD
uniref:histidine phosphatase family protein n=1 Tax=Henriciella pelagia TaxID=1977912 RepID=UPI0035133E8D